MAAREIKGTMSWKKNVGFGSFQVSVCTDITLQQILFIWCGKLRVPLIFLCEVLSVEISTETSLWRGDMNQWFPTWAPASTLKMFCVPLCGWEVSFGSNCCIFKVMFYLCWILRFCSIFVLCNFTFICLWLIYCYLSFLRLFLLPETIYYFLHLGEILNYYLPAHFLDPLFLKFQLNVF